MWRELPSQESTWIYLVKWIINGYLHVLLLADRCLLAHSSTSAPPQTTRIHSPGLSPSLFMITRGHLHYRFSRLMRSVGRRAMNFVSAINSILYSKLWLGIHEFRFQLPIHRLCANCAPSLPFILIARVIWNDLEQVVAHPHDCTGKLNTQVNLNGNFLSGRISNRRDGSIGRRESQKILEAWEEERFQTRSFVSNLGNGLGSSPVMRLTERRSWHYQGKSVFSLK